MIFHSIFLHCKKKPPLYYAEKLLVGQYENASQRLQLYLQLNPDPDAKFYCLLHLLPGSERREAVLNSFVQEKVEVAVRQRLPTFFLLSDLIKIVLAISFFGVCVSNYIAFLFLDCATISCTPKKNYRVSSIVVLIAGAHFLFREVLQVMACFSSGYFKTWWSDPWNLVDVISIAITIVWPSIILSEKVTRESSSTAKEIFRSLSTLAAGFLFILVFSFLKRVSIDAAVFVRGSIAVAKQLLSFLMALVVIITAFSLMFFIVFSGSTDCSPFCSFASSWFEVYNMILGNYGPDDIFGNETLSGTEKYILYIL
jgi:hypothetical protein